MRVEKPVIVEKPWEKEMFLCCNDRYIMEIMEIKRVAELVCTITKIGWKPSIYWREY